MKADPDVKMISAEAPILFAKGCDIFITELTMRAWIHAEENKRRTLQRSDIASALAKSDMFDFLIDIVPREEAAQHAKRAPGAAPPQGGVPGQPGGTQLPPQLPPQQPTHNQTQHMTQPPSYMPAPGLQDQPEFHPQPVYGQPNPAATYGAPPPGMYNEMDPIYSYTGMGQPQQVSLEYFSNFASLIYTKTGPSLSHHIPSTKLVYLNILTITTEHVSGPATETT